MHEHTEEAEDVSLLLSRTLCFVYFKMWSIKYLFAHEWNRSQSITCSYKYQFDHIHMAHQSEWKCLCYGFIITRSNEPLVYFHFIVMSSYSEMFFLQIKGAVLYTFSTSWHSSLRSYWNVCDMPWSECLTIKAPQLLALFRRASLSSLALF